MKTFLFILLAGFGLSAQPQIDKVEPPNWWTGHSINPVRLLIHGSGLKGARLSATDSGIQLAGTVKTNDAGTYLFVDVKVLRAGDHPLKITTTEGTATAAFRVLAPLPREGRFQGFSPDDLIYLIMPDRFANGDPSNDDPAISHGLLDRTKPRYYHGGDLAGVIEHLPYLKELGVTAIWLNPVYDNVNHLNERERYNGQAITDYHGYGAVDFYSVDEHLGTLATLGQLTDAAHRQGIKIILDMVANHTGPYHPWVKDSPTPTWFHGTESRHVAETWQTWTLADPHAPASLRKATLDGWFLDLLPDLNQDDPEVARYIIQNTLWWVGATGLDGIRQDTLPYVPREFWRAWMAAIRKEYPNFRVVGEMFDGDASLVAFFQGGKARFDGVDSGVDALFDFPLFYAIRRAFANHGALKELSTALGHDYLYEDPNYLVMFLGLHDVERFMNEKGATVDGLLQAFTFLLTTRGIPMIYYGDEIAMPGGPDPDNRRDFPGGWVNDAANAFTEIGRTQPQALVFSHVRLLARLREQFPVLRHGALTELVVSDQAYAYARAAGRQVAIIVLNRDAGPVEVPAISSLADGTVLKDWLGNVEDVTVRHGSLRVQLPARSACVLVPK